MKSCANFWGQSMGSAYFLSRIGKSTRVLSARLISFLMDEKFPWKMTHGLKFRG